MAPKASDDNLQIVELIKKKLIGEYQNYIKPQIFLSFTGDDKEKEVITHIRRGIKRMRKLYINVCVFKSNIQPSREKGDARKIREQINRSIGFIVIHSEIKSICGEECIKMYGCWPIFEMGIAFAFENRMGPFNIFIDSAIKNSISTIKEYHKLYDNICKDGFHPYTIDFNDNNVNDFIYNKIHESVSNYIRDYWNKVTGEYIKDKMNFKRRFEDRFNIHDVFLPYLKLNAY